jgi:hypothetical protein
MHLALLLVLAQSPQSPQSPTLVDIRDLSPREHEAVTFVLTAAAELKVKAVGAEPRPERMRERTRENWQDEEQTTWPAAAWILDARTRAVVWDMRAVETRRESNGLRHFDGSLRLPAGTYEAHYASYPASFVSFSDNTRRLSRLGRGVKFGGPYVDDGLYKQFALSITGPGHVADEGEARSAREAFTANAIATIVPDRASSARQGFELTRTTAVDVYAIGEVTRDQPFDYGWILDADTHERVWTMTYENTEPAGGSHKNRLAHETLRLKPGRYAAYFFSDNSHDPEEWNGVPATDPEFWGLTLRVLDPAARATVKPFTYEPVPAGQTIVSLIGVRDDQTRSAGFTLRRRMDVRIYALGEGSEGDPMVDYGWIVNAETHERVWTMRREDTEAAGGADKNRLFDGTIRLAPGSYIVYYVTDGSHAYNDWNTSAPAEERYWGISLFPASGKLNPADVGPFERPTGGTLVAQLTRMGDEEDARRSFQLERQTRLRVYAIGEGSGDEMYDYGWIEDARGRVVWQMHYDETEPAGGADKNRAYDGVVTLPAGSYVLRFKSDGSHSHADWNSEPPDDPESWGISVFRLGNR